MNKPIIFMFSGQGSQYYGMGRELFNKHPTFHKWMLKMDGIVFKHIGKSILEEIYDNSKSISQKFDCVLYTHPAIFMIEYALAQILLEKEIMPDYLLGSSLGEYTSMALSGVLNVEDIIECIVKQAVIFENYCTNGGMLAVLKNQSFYYENPQLFENSELASVNYHSHFVVSADNEKLKLITNFLKSKDIICQLLPINYGFHSSLINSAEEPYKSLLKTKSYKKPKITLISSLSSKILAEVPKNFLWDVIRNPIEFQKTIQELEKQSQCIYLDLGPSGTMANFVKQNLTEESDSECYSIITPFNQDLKYFKQIESLFKNKL